MDPNARIFFDISSLIEYVEKLDRYSGIQRVVTMLLCELQLLPGSDRFFVAFRRNHSSDELITLPLTDIGKEVLVDPLLLRAFFFNTPVERGVGEVLSRYRDRKLRYHYHRSRLDLAARMRKSSSFRRYGITPTQWQEMRAGRAYKIETKLDEARPLKDIVEPSDTLMLIDSSWNEKDLRVFVKAKSLGLRIGSLVYDLIPILMPQVVHANMPRIFRNWLIRSTEYTDFYMTISESVRDDLLNFLSDIDKKIPVTALPLTQNGLDEHVAETKEAKGSEAFQKDMNERFLEMKDSMRSVFNVPFAICVGTIEARKNGWRLALAWKYLIDRGHVDIPRLVFAGRRGWYVDELFSLLQATGNIYGYVTVIEGPTDDELDLLYRGCEFALMPSLYEGWGLPVGEALSYGKTAIVGNGSSLPEVGQDLVEYCDATSVVSIAEAVLSLHQNSDRRRELEERVAAAHLRTWADVAADMLKIVRA